MLYDANHAGRLLEIFAEVARHGGGDAVSDEDDDGGGEGDDKCIAPVVGGSQDTPSDRVNHITGNVKQHFGKREPDERSREGG